MPVTFKVPKSPAKSVYKIDQFKGVDFSNSPINVDDNKSPNAINMIRDVPDKVRKRMGYEVVENYVNPDTYIENYADISFRDDDITYTSTATSYYRYYDSQTHTYRVRSREISATTTKVSVTYNTDDKTISLYGWCNEPVYATTPSIQPITYYYDNSPYSMVIAVGVPAGSYKMTFFPMSVSSASAIMKLKIGGETYTCTGGQKVVFDVTLSEESDLELVLGGTGSYSQHITSRYENDKIAVNIIKTTQYDSEQEYIPHGSNIPTDQTVYGCHYRREDEYPIYHAGKYMIQNGTILYSNANKAISHSWQFNENLYIMDGKKLLVYDGTTLEPVSNNATIPLVTISRDPIWGDGAGGGGTPHDPFNLMTPWFTEGFVVTADSATSTQFPMSVSPLGAAEVTAQIMDANGDWIDKVEGTDFDVNRTTGIITFHTAPGESPITGQDNVQITAQQSNTDYDDRINKCTFGTRFGVNGAYDRLFVSGNPDYPNFDWHSEIWDLKYFPDNSYSTLGSSKSAVVGYSIVSNYLAAHKDEMEDDMSIIIREGDMIDDKATFRIINTLQGQGAIASNSFLYLSTEPIFLTRSGLYAITAQDITGEKYSQSRSFYLNGKLCEEDYDNLCKSFAVIYNDMYILCVNEPIPSEDPDEVHYNTKMYILDGLQPMRTDKSEPYSTRQYAAFYCEMKDVSCMWERENRLYFGTVTGQVCRFYDDKDNINSFNDAGQPIYCCWETPDIDGQLFYKNKSLRYVAIRVGSALATSVKIYAMERGIWKFIKQDNTFARYFSFENLQFSKFAFSGNKTPQISRTKLRIKRVDKYRLRFVNEELNEPFTLYNIANEYTESGNYKG